MIRRVDRAHTKEEVLNLLDPTVREWFSSKFKDLSPPQAYAVPLIHEGKNVLVASPTGSGKTLTAFLSIINELLILAKKGDLEDHVYCVYISPLKALANDIERNLNAPLREIYSILKRDGLQLAEIRVAVRTGDTATYARQKMLRKPPHILITTPETLSLILSTVKFRYRLKDVKYVIVDEIHEISNSKRGVSLSLSLERLEHLTERPLLRIGLSATQSPIEEIGKFLAGYDGDSLREMNVVEIGAQKSLDLQVMCPVADMTVLPFDVVNAKMYDMLTDLIRSHRTTLVFTNTRSGTEAVVYKLKERGITRISAHHGSLSKETRLNVEEMLKNGEMDVVVTSTSLELGIDIGYIDLVVQIGSPKSIAKCLQRIGRSGHALHETSKGRITVFELDDLVESLVLVKCAYEGRIDRTYFLHNCLDVLAQTLVGMSLEKRWSVDEAYAVVRRSYLYRSLSKETFQRVLEYISGRHSLDDKGVYGKLWYDPEEGTFGIKRGSRMIYFMNLGTIPQESNYHVYLEYGLPLGTLSESFVERLRPGDIFLLGGRTYELVSVRGTRLYVKDAKGRKPTVPSWTGEMLPRSYDLSMEVGRFRHAVEEMLASSGEDPDPNEIEEWIMREYRADMGSARTVVNYMMEQLKFIGSLPTHKRVVIEGYIDGEGRRNIVFHYCFGRRVNDALSRAYAYALSKRYRTNVRVSLTDDTFMLTLDSDVPLEDVKDLVTTDNLLDLVRRAVRNTELFRQRFRHCGVRSFMILRNFKGHEIPVRKQMLRSHRVLSALHRIENFPVIEETYNEILHDVMDIDHAMEVIKGIETGEIEFTISPYSSVPSPFAHNVILMGMSDIVLMEDRSALLRELHKKVLAKVFQVQEAIFTDETVEAYFGRRRPRIVVKDDVLRTLREVGALRIFVEIGENIMNYTDLPRNQVLEWASELLEEGAITSIWMGGVRWIASEDLPIYAAVYACDPPRDMKDLVLRIQKGEEVRSREVRPLERAYIVHRTSIRDGKVRWGVRKVERGSPESAVEELIRRYLALHAPAMVQEIAHALYLEDAFVDNFLRDMERRGLVKVGYFVPSKGMPQYMLTRDVTILQKGGAELVYDAKSVRSLILKVMFREVEDIREFFRVYGVAMSVRQIFLRVRKFDFNQWVEMLRSGEIIQGRFVGGHVCYIPRSEASAYIWTYRKEMLNERDRQMLDVIRENPGITRNELIQIFPWEKIEVIDSLTRLDTNLYVYRLQEGESYWRTMNRYAVIEPDPWTDALTPEETIILRFLRSFGAAPVVGIRYYTRIDHETIISTLESLRTKGLIQQITSIGNNTIEMFVPTEYMDELDSSHAEIGVRILSLSDPYAMRLRSEIVSRFGEGWYSIVIRNGSLIGAVHLWPMSGCIDIRDVIIQEEDLDALLSEMDRLLEYYRNYFMDVIRIRRINGRTPEDMSERVIASLRKAGYQRCGNRYVKGVGTVKTFTDEQIMNYILHRQHVAEERRFNSVIEAIESMGGIRSDYELSLRLRGRPISLDAYQRSTDIPRALLIPDYLMVCTYRDLLIYRSAKDVPITPKMRHVLMRIPEFGISRARLQKKTDLSPSEFRETLKKLYDGLHVIRDGRNRYVRITGPEMPVREARKWVVKRIIENFGIITAEKIASIVKHRFRMSEIRSILRDLESEGVIIKGFLRDGSDTLYWIICDDLDDVESMRVDRRFVLSPKDQLYQYLFEEVKRQFGLTNCFVVFDGPKMIGAFKAREKGGRLTITRFEGDWSICERIIDDFAHRLQIDVIYAA